MQANVPPSLSTRRKRGAVALSGRLEKNLLAYTVATTAGFLAFAQPASAQVVYTASNTPLGSPFGGGVTTEFDINNDGTPDFIFSNYSYFSHGFGAAYLKITPAQTGNEIVGIQLQSQNQVTAAGITVGVPVGSTANFQSAPRGLVMGGIFLGTSGGVLGTWATVETAYLGLKFTVGGQVHYGWARVKLVSPGAYTSGSIYGSAYESTANKSILTGATSGPKENNRQSTSTLGMLAAGAR